jgi:hypothetical protein
LAGAILAGWRGRAGKDREAELALKEDCVEVIFKAVVRKTPWKRMHGDACEGREEGGESGALSSAGFINGNNYCECLMLFVDLALESVEDARRDESFWGLRLVSRKGKVVCCYGQR